MRYFLRYILTAFILLMIIQNSSAQTTLQVLTKKIQEEYSLDKSDVLIIRAEKGVIDIQPSESNKVKLEIKIVVKNKDIKTAKKELEYVHWDSYKKHSAVYLSNNIVVPNNANLKSIVRVEYLIHMPQGANLIIENSFGQVKVSGLSCTGKIDIQYCDLILQNTSGSIDVESNIGDLSFSGFTGSLNVDSKYSAIKIDNSIGKLELSSTYGSIKVNTHPSFSKLDIMAERCDVTLLNKSCTEFALRLEAKYANIDLNETCYIRQKSLLNRKTTGSQPNVINAIKYSPNKDLPVVQIKSNYGNISMD